MNPVDIQPPESIVKWPIICLIMAIFLILFGLRLLASGGFQSNLSKDPPNQLVVSLQPISHFLNLQLSTLLPEEQFILLSGMLLGIQSPLPPELKTALTNTSTIHIVVVSGQNLSLVAGFIMAASPWVGRKKMIGFTLFGIIFYSLLTGLQVPVIRAALMISMVLLAQLLGKDRLESWILVLTGMLMLLINPNWLLSISFQLSFVATYGALIYAKTLLPLLKFLPDLIREEAAVSIAAQLLTMPIIAANFHQISLFGVIANTLVLWTVSPIMLSGLVVLAISLILPPLATLLALIPYALLTYFLNIVTSINSLPWTFLQVGEWNLFYSAAFYCLLLAAYFWLKHRQTIQSELA